MEMQQVRYFLALSRSLNFRRAADECNVSQPALSRAIQGLEAEFGGVLIHREGRLTHLTALGRRMLPLMQECFDAANTARQLAKDVKSSEAALLPIAVARSINMELLVTPLRELFRAFPGIQLTIRRGVSDETIAMLKAGEVDLVVAVASEKPWDRLDSWQLFSEPFVLVIHRQHHLSRSNMLQVHQLVGEKLFICSMCEMARQMQDFLAGKQLSASDQHEVDMDHDMLALIEANGGAGLLPASTPIGKDIRVQRLDDLPLHRTVSVFSAAGRQRSTVAATLLNLLRTQDWPEWDAK